MAACLSQIKNITALSFYLFVLIINRMLALLVFKNAKGTGSASNKALKFTPFGRWDAYTRGGFAIMPHASAPLSLKLYACMIQFVVFSIWIFLLTILGSWLFELSFAVSFAFVTILIFLGHLVTLDEDLKGGWSNPEGNTRIRNTSLIELAAKLIFSIVVWYVVITFPELSMYGI